MWTTLRAATAALVLLPALTGCTSTDEPPAVSLSQTVARGCDSQLLTTLGEWERAGFSGTISVLRAGEPDCSAAVGAADQAKGRPNSSDTVFAIGSVSKAYAAAAVATLVEQGSLRLSDTAGDLVAGLTGPVAEATVGSLLTHTSGLRGSHGVDHQPLSKLRLVHHLSRLEQAFPAGQRYVYSNAGYSLLALVVEEVSGSPYREFIVEHVLGIGGSGGGFWDGEPAAPGPRAVGYPDGDRPTDQMGQAPGPHWALSGNGDLAMTTDQLASWARGFFKDSAGDLDEILAQPGRKLPPEARDPATILPGWGLVPKAALGERLFGSAGGGGEVGHNAIVAWSPSSDVVIAAASNTQGVLAERLVQRIGGALLADEPIPGPPTPPSQVDPDSVAAAVGSYDLTTGGAIEVTATDTGLDLVPTGADAIAALFPAPGHTTQDVARHESLVLALLAGESAEGRQERAGLADQVGEITDVRIDGTTGGADGLQTYATVTGVRGTVTIWYELDEAGGIQGANGPVALPTLSVHPDDGTFIPFDPTAPEPSVRIGFADATMTIRAGRGEIVGRSR